jgi:hypothetical protein
MLETIEHIFLEIYLGSETNNASKLGASPTSPTA